MSAVPQAAVDAAMKAMRCEKHATIEEGVFGCWIHLDDAGDLVPWDKRGCVEARAVAAAVVAAVQGPITRAGEIKALRDAAWALDIPNTKPHTREDWIGATGAPDWLRARADRIEATS